MDSSGRLVKLALDGPQPRALVLALLLAMTILIQGGGSAHAADLAAASESPSCKPAFPRPGSSCSRDRQCCAGLVCRSEACRSGCRVGGVLYAAGARNPANACQTCQPATSTSAFTNAPNGASCRDDNACTRTDTCQAGICIGANPVTCSAQDQCHVVGTCNTSTGICSNPAKANGAACSDGNTCTRRDSCRSGICMGANPVTCSAQDQCHVAGTCNTSTGICSNPAKANGAACNDGNGCTRRDTCQTGSCTGSNPVICQSSDQCHDPGTCNPSTGICSSPAKADGAACGDGNACTTGDRCQAGICSGSGAILCISPDSCHDGGTCDTRTGVCSFPARPNGTACNDGNACTTSDSCQGGTCTGSSPVTCPPAADQCHDAGSCDAATGVCSSPTKPDGTACDDGNACTSGDRCLSGACTGAALTFCFPLDDCHDAGSCDTTTGLCSRPPKPDGAACSDGNACTSQDTCLGGTCTGSSPVICLPPGQCQDPGTCESATGHCVYPAKPDGTTCSDGNACSTVDTCQAGTCTGSAPVICPPLIPAGCHGGAADCNPANGQCVPRPSPNGTACDDGNPCTSSDACQAGVCTGSPCGAGQVCCSQGEAQSCVNITVDSSNCGACGHQCVNSACLRGQCYDGCVVNGVGYANGTRNPGNDCQACDVGLSRTAWTPLGTVPGDTNRPTCHDGCFVGFCFSGACGSLGGSGGCVSTTCAASSCQNGTCVATPINEGAVCTPSLSTNPCRSGSTGTCHEGDCIAANANEGSYCAAEGPVYGTAHECRSTVNGTCQLGGCHNSFLPDGTTCHHVDDPGRGLCFVGSCSNGDCPSVSPSVSCDTLSYCGEDGLCDRPTGLCVYPPHDPYPTGGTIACNNGFDPNPSRCCPGQVCICTPVPEGVPQFCLNHECWTPSDIPHGYP